MDSIRLNCSVICFLLVLTASGCHYTSTITDSEADKREGLNFAHIFFDLLKEKKYEQTFNLYDDTIWKITTQHDLLKFYLQIDSVVGKLDSIKIDGWHTKRIEGSKGYTEYNFIFHNKYEKGKMKEQLFFRKNNSGITRIVTYRALPDVYSVN